MITPKMDRILRAVADSWETRGYGPTYREVGIALGLKSVGGMYSCVERLIHAGLLRHDRRVARSLRLTPEGESRVKSA